MSFDTLITRRGTGSIKWDRRPDLDPYWVADMDFVSPPEVISAINERVAHGVFGYAHAHDGLNETLISYLAERHGANVDLDSIVHLGGLVVALSLSARAFGNPGDELMTCTPVYPPFLNVAKDAQMNTVAVPHTEIDGKFTFDFEAMEAAVTEKTKVFLLCNPQNPLGRSFTKEEVTKVAEFCHRHSIYLISDEIHCDLVFNEDERPFFSALHLPEELRQKLVVLQAPSKTYNIAGLGYAFAVIENDSTRRAFNDAKGSKLPEINCIAFYAAEAAYKHGESWRQALLTYLKKNRDTISDFIRSEMPYLQIPNIEATYLAWINCGALKTENAAQHLEKDAGLFLSDGAFFSGADHIRFNYGCTNARVLEGLEKIKTSFDKIR